MKSKPNRYPYKESSILAMRTVFLLAALLCLLLSCGIPQNTVKIGFAGQLSGPGGTPSTIIRNGAILAAEKINALGGINGREVELIVRDDRGSEETAVAITRELYENGVSAIIGHTTSSMSAASLDYINEKELLMLSPSSSAEYLMNRDDYFFSIFPGNSLLAETSAGFAFTKLGLRKIGAIVDTFNSFYTDNYYQNFRENFEARGGTLTGRISYNSTTNPHFGLLCDEILKSGPDGLFLVSASLDTAMIIQQLYKRNMDLPLIGVEWSENQELIEQGGPLVENLYIANLYSTETSSEDYRQFTRDYKKRFNAAPSWGAAMGYEAFMVISQALSLQEKNQPLKDVLLSTAFRGLQEDISFDSNGDVNRKINIHTIRNKSFISIDN